MSAKVIVMYKWGPEIAIKIYLHTWAVSFPVTMNIEVDLPRCAMPTANRFFRLSRHRTLQQ